MFRSLLRIRYLAAVVSLVFAVHAAGFLTLALLRGYHAYSVLLRGERVRGEGRPGIEIAESVDALLFSLVLLVLSLGTSSLFLAGEDEQRRLPDWMRIKSLTGLKLLLWEAILATLVVTAATGLIAALPDVEWRHLILPLAVLILSVSYFLLKRIDPTH